jgi:pimeloyl-ACP methyl ester carboxylesterase
MTHTLSQVRVVPYVLSRFFLVVAALSFLAACSEDDDTLVAPSPYADEALWLCKPGITLDRCLELDQTITYVYEDGNMAVFEHEPVVDAAFDCFYIYPTVDQRPEPGNTLDLTDDSLMLRPLYNQAARFTELCNVYAPKYRQMTIGSYGVENVFESEYFELGYADVEEAFSQYLLENPGRNFVLMGHSQGSHVLLRMLKTRLDNDAELRSRMISALVIGPTGALQVPPRQLTGGTFDNIPLCTYATDTGCIVAYDSIAAGGDRPVPAQPRPCVNPSLLGGEPGIAANTIYNNEEGIPFPEGVMTNWIAYPDLYAMACESDGFLGVDTAPNRTTVFTPQLIQAFLGATTLHLADYTFAIGDLLRIVESQAANH